MSDQGLPKAASCRCGRGADKFPISECNHEDCPHKPPRAASANERQVGGAHYQAAVQHWDLIELHGCGYLEGCATKYLTRWRKKNGLQDLEKSLHYAQKLQELFLKGKVKPRGIVPDDVMTLFVRSNDIGPKEARVIDMLCSWSGPNLAPAIALIEELVAEAKAAPPHVDNTGQAQPFGFKGES